MRSTSAPTDAPDRTARARIRDAAIAGFADAGVDGTSVRTIAAASGVSPGLVIHHFGSKEGLRVACDQHVAAVIRAAKSAAMAQGTAMDPVASVRSAAAGPPVLAYLARTLGDGSPHVADLIDEMVADAVEYMAEGERTGVVTPAEDPHGRAAVLVLWSLGALVLHEHARRLLGADLLGDPDTSLAYMRVASQVLGQGVITPEAYAQMRDALDHADEEERS